MKNNSFASIALWITVANIIGKILGFGKDLIISYYYGISSQTDALFLALSVPTIILGVFTSSTDSAIIPQYNRILSQSGRIEADRNFSNVLNVTIIIGFIISLLILIFPSVFINIFAPGFNCEQSRYAIIFLRFFSFVGLCHILYCYFCSYAIIYKHITTRAILSFSTNLIVVIALFFFNDKRMYSLAYAYLIGSIISAFLPLSSVLKLGYKHKIIINLSSKEFKKFWVNFMPIMAGAFLLDFNLFVDRFIASSLGEGSISYLNYASRITSLFDSMLIIGIGVAIIPLLSQLNVEKNIDKFKNITYETIKFLFILLLPIVILAILLSDEIIQILYYRGNFDMESVKVVSWLLKYYSPLILLIPMQGVVSKVFHSTENTRIPFIITLMAVVLNIILSVSLSRFIGIDGIALGSTIAVFFNVTILIIMLIYKYGWSSALFTIRTFISVSLAVIILLLLIFSLKNLNTPLLIKLLIVCSLSLIGYLITIFLTLNKELKALFLRIKSK